MEDVEPPSEHEINRPLPEAGDDPADPLRPDLEEEDLPNPPLAEPHLDVEATEEVEDGDNGRDTPDLSDAESALSDLDDAEFEDFDAANVAIDDRTAIAVDESNVGLLGVHKRKRAEGEDGTRKKKKEGRREKPRRKKREEEDNFSGGEELEGKRARKRKDAVRPERRAAEPENEEDLTPEERRKRALDRAMEEALRGPGKARRRKADGIDIESLQDKEIDDMRNRMTSAAQADTSARDSGKPAFHKLKLLPEVVELLNRNTIQHNLVDPDNNLLEAVRFFLEPLNDGSMPAYNIQRDLIMSLAKLPIGKDALVSSQLGKVLRFYTHTKAVEPEINRAADKLVRQWTRLVLKGPAKDRAAAAAAAGEHGIPVRGGPVRQVDAAREKMLEAPNMSNRARAAVGPGQTYTIAPQSGLAQGSQYARAPGASGEAAFNRMKARHLQKSGGRGR